MKIFELLKNAAEANKEFHDPTFISFYPVKMGEHIGFLLIDGSKGYYPLVIYPQPKISDASRKDALKNALDDLSNSIDRLISRLDKAPEWTADLQQELQNQIFHYSEDKDVFTKAA